MANNKNNDPIQDYVPFGFNKIDEIFSVEDEYYDTDLHDCSNDLSFEGSKREEREHAKFAEKIRKKNNVHIEGPAKAQNSFVGIVVIFIFVIMISVFFSIYSVFNDVLLEQSENSYFDDVISNDDDYYNYNYNYNYDVNDTESKDYDNNYYDDFTSDENYYDDSYTNYYDDESNNFNNYYNTNDTNESSESQVYVSNIQIQNINTNSNKFFLELTNNNIYTYTNLQATTDFYDYAGNFLGRTVTPIDVLIGNNKHYIEVSNVPENSSTYETAITSTFYSDTEYYDTTNLNLKFVDITDTIKQFRLTNYTGKRIVKAELIVAYCIGGTVVEIDKVQFPSVADNEEIVMNYTLEHDKYGTDSIIMTINDVDLFLDIDDM